MSSENDKYAVAAHLHVLLRRKAGRVTDTDWMVHNLEYAREILRLARAQADADLDKLAERFELVMFAPAAPAPVPLMTRAAAAAAATAAAGAAIAAATPADEEAPEKPAAGASQYVRSLR